MNPSSDSRTPAGGAAHLEMPPAAASPRGRRAPRLLAAVHDARWIAPRMRRLRLGGADLARFVWPGSASHLKLVLPLDTTPWPSSSGEGEEIAVLLDPKHVVSRTYTPRRWDAENCLLSIDMFLHGDGVAARWGAAAEPGDRVAVSVPKARFVRDPQAAWLVVAGDEAAAPAIATILDADEGQCPVHAYVETSTSADTAGLDERATIVPRDGRPAGTALHEAVTASLPDGIGQVWVAGEAGAIRTTRRWLLAERGFAGTSLITRGYWRRGGADHPDHDFGD